MLAEQEESMPVKLIKCLWECFLKDIIILVSENLFIKWRQIGLYMYACC